MTVTNWITLFPVDNGESYQKPIGGEPPLSIDHSSAKQPGQVFRPPGSNIDGFQCNYSAMGPSWVDCSTTIPGCWLRNTATGEVRNVTTNYEDPTLTPIGITRNYTLYLTENNTINADGLNFTDGRMFNGQFPGPLLEACWGDTINVTIVNNMTFNGTSIHWHGIRQWRTMHMDGVNGITQCPIAPGDSFNYVWKVMQYGSSWYHSHYSVQYADGLQGPIVSLPSFLLLFLERCPHLLLHRRVAGKSHTTA